MGQVKKYELVRKMYVPIKNGASRSYGGRQQWFAKGIKETRDLKSYFTHQNGCGVIALADLFLYLSMTHPEGKITEAAQFKDKYGNVYKDQYMIFVEKVRDHYARIYGSCGTFGWQLSHAVNSYCKDNGLQIHAEFEAGLTALGFLNKLKEQISHNYPVILMIGQSSPVVLSRLKKTGIPFFKQVKVHRGYLAGKKMAYADYEVAEANVYGHFVMVTGIIIDENAAWASQRIMLRIASWGSEYYISYAHYCRYMQQISKPWLCGIVTMTNKE